MNRAYAVLEIKAMDDAKRTFTGIATTPTPDRVGDIVEPKGAEFRLPIPLLWQHSSFSPIGWVRAARISDKGIEVDCEVHNEREPGTLKERLDEAWQSMRAKLVGGLSIGFKPLESVRIGETYSYRFPKWLWLELSPVTIPANGDCNIETIKSADRLLRRADASLPIVRLDRSDAANSSPGASGIENHRRKGVVYLKGPLQ
jgi:HK97 family phage prohead protease